MLGGILNLRHDAETIKFRLRTEANMTLRALATALGRDPSTISMVISGRRLSAPITRAILELLDEDDPAALWPSKFAQVEKSEGQT